MYEPFEALYEYSEIDKYYTTTVNPNPLPPHDREVAMILRGEDGWIYITKEQAMKFFGLVEAQQAK